jgi:hypothetical protein
MGTSLTHPPIAANKKYGLPHQLCLKDCRNRGDLLLFGGDERELNDEDRDQHR